MNTDNFGIPIVAMLIITSDDPEAAARNFGVPLDELRQSVRGWALWYVKVPEEMRDRIHNLLVEAAKQ